MNNWITDKVPVLSTMDKLNALLKIGYKLVLVQFHELERIKLKKYSHTERYQNYINALYNDYIVKSLPKTYLTP